MRLSALTLAVLLFACAGQNENAVDNAAMNIDSEGSPTAPGDVPIDNGSAPPPGAPAAPVPPNGQPPADEPRPEPVGSVTLSASPAELRAGATSTLRLTNNSREQIGYNLCTSALQTSSGSAVRTDRVCTLELRTLDPGRSATYAYELPDELAPGSYRFSTGVDWMRTNRRTSVASNSFRVTAG